MASVGNGIWSLLRERRLTRTRAWTQRSQSMMTMARQMPARKLRAVLLYREGYRLTVVAWGLG